MNPARSPGPDLIAGDFSRFWIYATVPVADCLLAVTFAWVLRGRGGQAAAEKAAQGSLPG